MLTFQFSSLRSSLFLYNIASREYEEFNIPVTASVDSIIFSFISTLFISDNANIIITRTKIMKRYTDILLYIPNLIGYLRILLLFVGCCMHNEVYFIMLIIISAGLDVAGKIVINC